VIVDKPENHLARVEINFKNVHEMITLTKLGYHGYYPIPIYNLTATNGVRTLTINHYFEGESDWKKELWRIKGTYNNLKVSYDVKVGVFKQDWLHLGYIGKDFGVAMGGWFLLIPIKTMKNVRVKFILPEVGKLTHLGIIRMVISFQTIQNTCPFSRSNR